MLDHDDVAYIVYFYALTYYDFDTAITMINDGIINLNKTYGKYNDTILMITCSYPNTERVTMALLDNGNIHIDHISSDMYTALIFAIQSQSEDVCMRMISIGNTRPDIVSSKDMTALMYACKSSKLKVAHALLDTGNAIPFYTSKYGDSAMSIARSKDLYSIVAALELYIE